MNDRGSLFLVGFMGAGKTNVGRALADLLGRDLVDTDALVERAEGRSIDRIFRESGEGYFREAEYRALGSLDDRGSRVVATGGGLFLGVAQRRLIRRHGVSVWLDVDLATARRRIGHGGTRPLWTTRDPIALRMMFEKRRAAYALADVRLEASRGSPAELARAVLDRLEIRFGLIWRVQR